ncbi:MAG: enoyl-CoA hydratase [Ilumatobacteraceae bacterium]|jgi:enoyl-CoA hydratase|nr:enoyl-CoA hydratase [Actinomycetes bacterium]
MAMVIYEVSDGIATLTLNNPQERNSMTADMVSEIVAAMNAAESDPNVRVVIVTGTPPAFCAGANLGNLAEATRESLLGIYEGFLRVARSPLPTIAAVNGAAVGAGMNLALGCDVRIAARSARFDSRFLQLGLHPGGGNTWMQLRIAGMQTTMATVAFGEVLDGEAALRAGLVWKCVDDAELMPTARALAAKAADAPKDLLVSIKKTIVEIGAVPTHTEAVEFELGPQVWSTRQPWFRERLAALQAKISKR